MRRKIAVLHNIHRRPRRKLWVSPLKTKDQVLSVFKEFHARVERETGRKLKAVRADNRGEYRGQFEEYCRLMGIRLEYTVPKTPELNGLAQRMNQTIMERVWSMLAYAKLSKTLVEAMMTTTYVINISPSAPLDEDVPQRMWTGKDVTYWHMKVFGCLVYVYVTKDKQGKLNSKTRPCIFLGYGDDEFGYRQWNLQEKKVAQSRDIVFMEEKNISYLDSKMKTTSFESTNRDRLEWTRIYLDKRRIPVEEQYEPAGFGQETEATGGGRNTETGEDPESDSDEEPTEEPVVENQGRRYPLRERRAPPKISGWRTCTADRWGGAGKLQGSKERHPQSQVVKCHARRDGFPTWEPHLWIDRATERKEGGSKQVGVQDETGRSRNPPRYKARIVVKGFQQKKGVDFNEIFAPVVKITSIRMVLSIVSWYGKTQTHDLMLHGLSSWPLGYML